MMDMGGTGTPLAAPEPNAIAAPTIEGAEIKRGEPQVDEQRKALVTEVLQWCKDTRSFRSKTFNRMRKNMEFVRPGRQWKSAGRALPGDDAPDDASAYEANIVQRHVQQRVAALYAKNPKVVARRRKRLDFKIWDGDQQSLNEALMRAQGSPGDPMMGIPPVPPAPTPEDIELVMDVAQGMNRRKLLDRVSKTLEVLYTYYLQEGQPSFKLQAKQLIRRVIVTGIGIVQIGFQRVMGKTPEITNRIRDDQAKIEKLQQLATDLKDGELADKQAEIEQLKLGLAALQAKEQIVLREGLVFDFPGSTDILVDRECVQLKGFVGAKRVAREYHYTKDQVKQIFGVDLGTNYAQYEPTKTWEPIGGNRGRNPTQSVAVIWAVWDCTTGLVYYVCDGYMDFLREPANPDVDVEGFFPFKVLSFNDIEDPNDIYPPSDVEIVRPMQLEYNRAREGLREHRIANKPGYVTARGMLDEEDKKAIQNHLPSELIELNLPPDAIKEIEKYFAARPTVPIQAEVYDTEYVWIDFQRVSGDQGANLGGVSGDVTATEASIAETSRVSSLQSCIDDVNDFLSDLARGSGQVLFAEISPEQVEKIVGPGFAWPELSREEIAEEIFLEIEAGSSGRPNKAVEIANMERMLPFLVQMKGLKPDWLLRQMMTRIEENADLEDAFDIKLPSVVATNAIDSAMGKAMAPGSAPGAGGAQVQPGTGKPNDPTQQGAKGADNAAGGPAGIDPSRPGPRPNFPVLTDAPAPV
jgi:hypothetical protein